MDKYKVEYYRSENDRFNNIKTIQECDTLDEAERTFHLWVENKTGPVNIIHPHEECIHDPMQIESGSIICRKIGCGKILYK